MRTCRHTRCGSVIWPYESAPAGFCLSCYTMGRQAFLAGMFFAGLIGGIIATGIRIWL